MARVLNPLLVACDEPDNEEVVRGILGGLFGAAGPRFAAKKMEERLHAHDVCCVQLLRQLTVAVLLEHFQMSYGEALTVDNHLFPQDQQPPPAAVVQAQQVPPPASSTATSRNAPEFPELGADGLPSAMSMRAWLPGFRSHLAGRVNQVTLAEYDELVKDVKYELALLYTSGPTLESEAVMTALLQAGTKGLPGNIVLSFPPLVVEQRLGLVALQDLLARVFTVSDSSRGVLLAWFQKPEFVTQLWLLGLALTKWLGVRIQLAAEGLPQSDIACRLSLLYLCSKLADLKAVFVALEVANPLGIPIQVLIDAVRARADSYSSLRGANSEVSVLAAGYTLVAQGEQAVKPKPKNKLWRTADCRQWRVGPCSYGDNCRYKHTGDAGQGVGKAALAQDMGPQLQALQDQVTALQKAQGNNNLASSNTANIHLKELEKNQDSPSRFNSPNVYDALSVSHGEVISDDIHSDNTQVGDQIFKDSDDNIHSDNTQVGDQINTDNALCVLDANDDDIISNRGGAGRQAQAKAVAEEQENRPPKQPNKSKSLGKKPNAESKLSPPPESVCGVPAVFPASKGFTLGGEVSSHRDKAVEPVVRPVTECPHGACSDPSRGVAVSNMLDTKHSQLVYSGTASLAQTTLLGKGLIGDTGATLRVIGADHRSEVVNVRPLPNPILLKTANSSLLLTTYSLSVETSLITEV